MRAPLGGLVIILLAGIPNAGRAQANEHITKARAAYEALDYLGTVQAAREALRGTLSREDRVSAFELLGFSYGALDSTRQAVDAFEQLIFLAPDRGPDVERVSPRITSLYASALGQVLVVRRVTFDSLSFIAGMGALPISFEVSRGAETSVRLIGSGIDLVIDSQTVTAGPARVYWNALGPDRRPVPPGDYEVIVTAREGARSEYASQPLRLRLEHGRVDTVAQLTKLPGYEEQPEKVTPPRDWRPAAMAALYSGLATGLFMALDDTDLGSGPRTAMLSVGGVAVAAGVVLSLRKPEPRPSPTNILYNGLLRELLNRRNAEIARENETRRSQTVLHFRPL